MNLCRLSAAKVVTGPSAVWVSATGTSPGSQPQFAHSELVRVSVQFGHGLDDGDFAGGRVWVVAMIFLLFPVPLFRVDVPAAYGRVMGGRHAGNPSGRLHRSPLF
jgi:hypothetical protein